MINKFLAHPAGVIISTYLLIFFFVAIATTPSSYYRRKPTLSFVGQLIVSAVIVAGLLVFAALSALKRKIF